MEIVAKKQDEFLFNLSCLSEYEKAEYDGWIYFINSESLSGNDGDNCIWKIKKDGTSMQKVQKTGWYVSAILGIVDGKWVHYICNNSSSVFGRWFPFSSEQARKMTLVGGLDRCLTEEEEDEWEDELDELYEEGICI